MFQQSSPPGDNGYISDSAVPYSFTAKVMACATILLFLIVFFIFILHVYIKWSSQRSLQSHVVSSGVFVFSRVSAAAPSQNNTGLDKATIAQLPTFLYTPSSPKDNLEAGESDEPVARPSSECAVCLSEFQENEKGRLLPACKHTFHTECIDMWLSSHSTCPICRTKVMPAAATSTETTSTDRQHQQMGAYMGRLHGTAEGNRVVSHAVEYPRSVLFWSNQTCVVLLQEPSSSSLPMSSSSCVPGARGQSQTTIDIPPNLLVSTSGCLCAKCTTGQEVASSSQPLGFRTSIKRMLSRQSSRHKSSSQEGYEETPK